MSEKQTPGYLLGLAQSCHPADGDVLSLVEKYLMKAVNIGVKLLVFPESLMTRYEAEKNNFLAAAEPLNGNFCQSVDNLAARYGIWVAYTVNEKHPDGGHPFNTVVLTGSDGRQRGRYRKVHLFDTNFTRESDRMSAGDQLFAPVGTPFGRIGLSICYDLRFPEVARSAALSGCQLLINPAAWVDGPGKLHQWKTLLTARAIENEMYVAGVCRADEGYIGHSCIVDPQGQVLAEGGDGEELVTATVDLNTINDVRSRMPVFSHRHPELYSRDK